MPYEILAKYLDQIGLKLVRSSANKPLVYSIRTGWYIGTTEEGGVS